MTSHLKLLTDLRFVLATMIAVLLAAPAVLGDGNYSNSMYRADPAGGRSTNPGLSFQTDEFTGAFGQSIPIRAPKGRLGSGPDIAISYGSSGGNGWLGVGWGCDVGYIERDTRNGAPLKWSTGTAAVPATPLTPLQYDDSHGFVFSFRGRSSRLVLANAGLNIYRAELDHEQLSFQYLDAGLTTNRWEVSDKSGVRFIFGDTFESAHSRQTIPLSTPVGASAFRWALSSSTDTNGNRTLYDYVPQPIGASDYRAPLYLREILYGGHTTVPSFTHSILFALEDRGGITPNDWDDTFSYRPGFRVETRKRLKSITVRVRVFGLMQQVRKYDLAYVQSTSTRRSLLASVTEYGKAGTAPIHAPMTFSYTEQTFEFEDPITWGPLLHQSNPSDPTNTLEHFNAIGCKQEMTAPISQASHAKLDLIDVDRDGLPDRVLIDRLALSSDPPVQYLVQHNAAGVGGLWSSSLQSLPFQAYYGVSYNLIRGGLGWTGGNGWPALCSLGDDLDIGKSYLTLMDINGDGFVDRIHDWRRAGTSATNQLYVEHGMGAGFDPLVPFGPMANQTALAGYIQNPNYFYLPWNSAQYVMADCDEVGGAPCNVSVCPGAPGDYKVGALVNTLIDVNGDGLPDRVARHTNENPTGTVRDHFFVQVNTGTGFEPTFRRWSFASPALPQPDLFWKYFWGNIMTFETGGQTAPSTSTAVGMFDINGDGLPDRLMRMPLGSANGWDKLVVQYNTGYGWTPYDPASSSSHFGPLGNPDNPSGSFVPYDYGSCSDSADIASGGPTGSFTVTMLQDVNADGLLDRVMQKKAPGINAGVYDMYVQLNCGTRFGPVQTYSNFVAIANGSVAGYPGPFHYLQAGMSYVSPVLGNDFGTQEVVSFRDMNGDGLPDRVMRKATYPYESGLIVQLAKGGTPDLLQSIENGIGGSIAVSYKPATHYVNRDQDVGSGSANPWAAGAVGTLSSPIQTVSQVRVNDGFIDSITTYDYYGGVYDYTEREFRGFYCVTKTDPLGAVTKAYFHQDGGINGSALGEYQDGDYGAGVSQSKRGMPFRFEAYADATSPIPYVVTINKVDEIQLNAAIKRWFPFVAQTATLTYEELASPRVSLESFEYYDPGSGFAGNLLRHRQWGEVISFSPATHGFTNVATNDDLIRELTYIDIPGDWKIKDRVDFETWKRNNGTIARETDYDYFDGNGNLETRRQYLELSGPTWIEESYTYDIYGNPEDHTRPGEGTLANPTGVGELVTTRTVWDGEYHAFPIQVISDYGSGTLNYSATSTYDPFTGQAATSTDWNGVTTRRIYDDYSRLEETWIDVQGQPSLWREKYEYTLDGVLSGVSLNMVHARVNDASGPDGHESFTYSDGLGRTIQVRVESEQVNQYVTLLRVSDTSYDLRGSPALVTRTYYSAGTAFKPLDVSKPHTLTAYDGLARPTSITPPAGDGNLSPTHNTGIVYKHSVDPWVKVIRDANWTSPPWGTAGKVIRERRDGRGRISRVEEATPDGVELATTYAYNLFGQLTKIIDHFGNQTEYTYDTLGRRNAYSDPDLGSGATTYFATGQVATETDANGHRTEYVYDHLGRVTRAQAFPSGAITPSETLSYFYDTNNDGTSASYPVFLGQLFKVADGQGFTRNAYDIRGRMIKTLRNVGGGSNSYLTQFTYDEADRMSTLTYPGGGTKVQYTYNAAGAASRVEALMGTGTTNEVFYQVLKFNVLGQPEEIQLGNGTKNKYNYYPESMRLQRVLASGGSGIPVYQSLTYTYDAVGNVKAIADGISTGHVGDAQGDRINIVYDGHHRLLSYMRMTPNGLTLHGFTYDAIGNLLTNGEVGTGTYVYPPSGPFSVRPHAVSSANGESFAYDNAGNMVARGPAGAQDVLEYDARNQLARVTTPGGSVITFGYDADGRRLWKQVGSRRTLWIGDYYEEHSGEQLAHVVVDGKRICTFEILPIPIGGGTAQSSPDDVFDYYHADHLGSPNSITKRDGTERQQFQYFAYGNELYVDDPGGFPVTHRYTDQALDGETGLYYYGARYYDPTLARFIQADTVTPDVYGPQSLNRYTYVFNNPFKYTDPSGNSPEDLIDLVERRIEQASGAAAGAFGAVVDAGAYLGGQVWEGAKAVGRAGADVASGLLLGEGAVGPGEVPSAATAAGQALGGEIPLADVRDIGIAGYRAATGQGELSDVGWNALGFVPFAGTTLKTTGRTLARGGESAAAAYGRRVHREFAEAVRQRPGWQSEQMIPGTRLRPDAIDPRGRPVELKPNTPSGHAQGSGQIERYKEATGTNGRVIYYPPPQRPRD